MIYFFGKIRYSSVNKTKTLYSWRSKAVHGARLAKLPEDKSAQVLYDVEELSRKSMSKILLNDKLIKKFDGKKRDEFLDDRLFECVSEKSNLALSSDS